MTKPAAALHLTAEFIGVPAEQLSDTSLLSGVLVAAAGAAGLSRSGAPVVLTHPSGGVSIILPVDQFHLTLHTMPDEEVALLDVLASPVHDPQRALDVVRRRLVAREVRTDRRHRG